MTTVKDRGYFVKRAKGIYEKELRNKLVKSHRGHIIKIDGRSGKYGIGLSASQSLTELKQQCDDPITYTARIGSNHVYDLPSLTVDNSGTSS